jgi:hypothetical protein
MLYTSLWSRFELTSGDKHCLYYFKRVANVYGQITVKFKKLNNWGSWIFNTDFVCRLKIYYFKLVIEIRYRPFKDNQAYYKSN